MIDHIKTVTARFYRANSGREPVREWLKSLPKEDMKIIGNDIKTVEFGWPVGMPVCRSLGKGLWEVRSNITNKKIARVIFCLHQNTMVLSKKRKKPRILNLLLPATDKRIFYREQDYAYRVKPG